MLEAKEGIYFGSRFIGPVENEGVLTSLSKNKIETIDLFSEGTIQGLASGEYERSGHLGEIGWRQANFVKYKTPESLSAERDYSIVRSRHYSAPVLVDDKFSGSSELFPYFSTNASHGHFFSGSGSFLLSSAVEISRRNVSDDERAGYISHFTGIGSFVGYGAFYSGYHVHTVSHTSLFLGNQTYITGYGHVTGTKYLTHDLGLSYLRSVYYNEIPVLNDEGKFNFQNVEVDYTLGDSYGKVLQAESPLQAHTRIIGERIFFGEDNKKIYRILNPNCRGIIVGMKTTSLFETKDNGNTIRQYMKYNIGYRPLFRDNIISNFRIPKEGFRNLYGKIATSPYLDSVRIDFLEGYSSSKSFLGWEIRIQKFSEDSITVRKGNTLVVDSLTELYGEFYLYPHSALVRSSFDAEFFSNIPERAFDVELLKVKIPGNYNPILRSYATEGFATSNGGWDGTFATGKYWTNNPAWCFYDMLTNARYGLGKYINESEVDKWSLYEIGKYCDELVADGEGGLEPRFTCNLWLTTREEAFKLINDLASIFRAMTYYSNGMIYAVQDSKKQPVFTFTNANVEDGDFNYSSTNRKDRHSVAIIRYNDPKNLYKPAVEYIDDVEAIKKYGIREVELSAFGCTSRAQAIRLGRWVLASDNSETDTINFIAGLEANYLKPGDIFKVSDSNQTIKRHGGRILEAININNTGARITLDDSIQLENNIQYSLSILTPSYNYDTPVVTNLNSTDYSGIRRSLLQTTNFYGQQATNLGSYSVINLYTGLDFNNYNISGRNVWSLEVTDPNYTGSRYFASTTDDYYRVVNIKEEDSHRYEIFGLQYNEAKFDFVESGLAYSNQITNVQSLPDEVSDGIDFNIESNSPDRIEYLFKGNEVAENTTSYYVYVKEGENFDEAGIPSDNYLANILPKDVSYGSYQTTQSGRHFFRIYAYNEKTKSFSPNFATGMTQVNTKSFIQYVNISSLSLISGEKGNSMDNSRVLSTNDSSPAFGWQTAFSNDLISDKKIYYRASIRGGGDEFSYWPREKLYEENFIAEQPWTFDFEDNVALEGGPYRSYQVAIEAHDEEGNTSAGNIIDGEDNPAQWNGFMENYDVIDIYNPRQEGIHLSNSLDTEYYLGSGFHGYYEYLDIEEELQTGYFKTTGDGYAYLGRETGNYRSTQYIGPNGNVVVEFLSGHFDNDLVGGYFYISTGQFPKYEAAVNTGDWEFSVYKTQFDFNPAFPKINMPNAAAPFLGGYKLYCSISFYDKLDEALISNGVDISTGIYISDNALIFNNSTIAKLNMGGAMNIYSLRIPEEITSYDDPIIPSYIGVSSRLINYSSKDGGPSVLFYMGKPLTGERYPFDGIPSGEDVDSGEPTEWWWPTAGG